MRLATLALLSPCFGCAGLLGGEAGYAHAFAQAPERSAATVNAYAGAGFADDHWGFGAGPSLRVKASDAIGQFSVAPFLFFAAGQSMRPAGPRAAFFALTGVDILTVESVANRGSVSLGSPFIEAGIYLRLFGDWGLAPAVSFEDDVRFNDIPNTGYVSFTLGFFMLDYKDLRLSDFKRQGPAEPAK